MNLSRRAVGAGLLSVAASSAVATGALAQAYPSKPIRIVVPTGAGGITDIVARIVGARLSERLGQPVLIDNRPGASGIIGTEVAARAAPDGYTLLMVYPSHPVNPTLKKQLPYDTLRDFTGVTQIGSTPMLIGTAAGNGIKTLRELITLAQQKPGQINYGSSGIGSGTHVGGELFRMTAGINTVHVPYKGTPEAINDTIAGRIHFVVTPTVPAVPLVRSGRLAGLAVTTRERAPILPDVPTVSEAALAGFNYEGWYGLIAPARTPASVIERLSADVGVILRNAEVAERLAALGALAKPTSAAEFNRMVRDEIVIRGKVLKAAGATAE